MDKIFKNEMAMKILSVYKIAVLLILPFYLISCSERDLDPDLHNAYTNVNFWKSKEEVEAGINGCYEVLAGNGLYGISGSNGFLATENITPNAYDAGELIPFLNGNLDPDNVKMIESRWKACYKGIGRVNTVLENFHKANLDLKDEEKVEGQALFLRALFYSNLVFYYGDVPLILEAPDLEKQGELPRTSMNKVVEQILQDLNDAAGKLPYSYTGQDIGRATKGAALALKARVLLYYASPLFNPENDVSRWGKAADAAKSVMESALESGYDLFPDYRGLFLEENENNEEVIFDVQYVAPRVAHSGNIIIELQQNVAPLLDLVNSYLMKDGKSIQNSALYNPDEPYENRDPRLLQTIVVPGSTFMGKEATTYIYNNTGFAFKKNTDYKDNETYSDYPIRVSGLNTIIMRYADVLLMYAEAENEASGPNISIYEALNKIRDRVGMPHIPVNLSIDQMRKVIRHERRIELAGEGLYYLDIRRWKIAPEVLNGPVYNSDGNILQTRIFDDKTYTWPISTTILGRNPSLEQTSGY